MAHEEYDDGEDRRKPIEGYIPERPEGDDFDVDIDVDVEDEDEESADRDHPGFRQPFGRHGPFGPNGVFGEDGPFGPRGPFGPDGPFGKKGPFGNSEDFAQTGPAHRRKRRKPMVRGGELRLVMLFLIAEDPRHGYELIREMEEMTGGSWAPSPGTVYPTLSLLEDEGLIDHVPGDDNRKAYRVTEAGLCEIEDNQEEIERLLRRLGRQAERKEQQAAPDLFRSLGNLAAVLTNRATTGGFDAKARAEIVDMIDALAKRIERL